MAKKTIKITFDETDPVYGFLAWYGARFGGRVGFSVAARIMIDHAYESREMFTPSFARTNETSCPIVENTETLSLDLVKDSKEPGKAELLSAIREFQGKL